MDIYKIVLDRKATNSLGFSEVLNMTYDRHNYSSKMLDTTFGNLNTEYIMSLKAEDGMAGKSFQVREKDYEAYFIGDFTREFQESIWAAGKVYLRKVNGESPFY